MKRTVALLALVAHAAVAQSPAPPPLRVIDVIGWLPLSTETLIVANGPFDPAPLLEQKDLASVAARMVAGPLDNYHDGEPFRELRGLNARFAVEGSRRFVPPRNLGLGLYEGCHVIVFHDSDSAAVGRLLTRLGASGGSAVKVAGFDAIRVTWHAEADDWVAFAARPYPHVLVTATNERMLAELLSRVGGKNSSRAFPASLPEWSGVDTTAAVWALRHYSAEGSDKDPTSPLTTKHRGANEPDTMAVGIAVNIFAGPVPRVVAEYYSRNPGADAVARRAWEPARAAQFAAGPNDAIQITVVSTPGNRDDLGVLLILVLSALGHPIYL